MATKPTAKVQEQHEGDGTEATAPAMEVRRVSLDDLHADPANVNLHDEVNLRSIRGSLKTFGQVEPLVVQKGTGKVIGGNGRLEVMRELGWTECDVVEFDADNVHATALGIALNRTAKTSTFDPVGLPEMLRALQAEDFDLDAFGLTDAEVDAMFAGDDTEPGDGVAPEAQVDRAEELLAKWKTAAGQVWQLGDHRVLIGDCRDADAVRSLFGDQKATIAFTSPPYASQREYDRESEFKPIKPDEYVEWWDQVQQATRMVLADDGSFFVNIKAHCDAGERSLYVMDLVMAMKRAWSWRYVDELAWTHRGLPGSWPNRFKNQWEPIHHFAVGGSIKFNPLAVGHESDQMFHEGGRVSDTNQTGNVGWHSGDVDRVTDVARPGNVIDIPNTPANHNGAQHAATFPSALPEFFLKAFSETGDIAYEPFGGSGTTLIAAERTGRRCYLVELSAKYVAVTLQRWSAATDREPSLVIAGNRA